jgi:hypothetical protein
MFRNSLTCLSKGVLFINLCPVVIENDPKECMSNSVFSEWLCDIVNVHHDNGRKLVIVSIGVLSLEIISDSIKS